MLYYNRIFENQSVFFTFFCPVNNFYSFIPKGDWVMDTEQLKYLVEVSKNTSIAAASEKLFMTSQAVSISIKKLEDELGFSLLNRSHKGVSLTNEGVWLVALAENFLSEIEKKQQQYKKNSAMQASKVPSYEGTLDIVTGILGTGNSVLAQLICILYKKQPKLKILVSEVSREEALSEVSAGRKELGFVYRTKFNRNYFDELPPDLMFEPLFQGSLVILANESYEFTKFESTSLKKIVKHPVCSYHHKDFFNSLNNLITNICKLDFNETTENSYDIFKEKIRQGLAISISIQFDILASPLNYIEGIQVVPVRDDIQIIFGMLKKKEHPLSEPATYFMTELRDMIAQLL